MNNNKLSVLLGNNDLAERLRKKTLQASNDKKDLLDAAKVYSQKYARDVEEGTKRKQLLITEGEHIGITAEEAICKHALFIPADDTPVLNFLHFILQEGGGVNVEKEVLLEMEEKVKNLTHNDDKSIFENGIPEQLVEYIHAKINQVKSNISLTNPNLENDMSKSIGDLYDDTYSLDEVKNVLPPSMEDVIYGSMTHADYVKVKKLKALSNSENESEASSAFIKCRSLCKKYGLDFDKVPSY